MRARGDSIRSTQGAYNKPMRPFFHRDFLCIGHRGAPEAAPENTLSSFALAIAQGADAIELDVQLVEDTLVVIHDDELDRTTTGSGRVDAISLEALRGLDAGGGERVPLLSEVLDLAVDKVGVNIELKGRGTAEPTAALLRERGQVPAGILLSAFDHRELAAARAVAPEYPRAALFGRLRGNPIKASLAVGAVAMNLHRRTARADLIGSARDVGLATLVYTVNDTDEALKLRHMGAAGIFTDVPERILQALGRGSQTSRSSAVSSRASVNSRDVT